MLTVLPIGVLYYKQVYCYSDWTAKCKQKNKYSIARPYRKLGPASLLFNDFGQSFTGS